MINDADVDHGTTGGLADDDHSQYALLIGRSGGQTVIGSTLTSEDLILQDNAVDGNTVTVTQAKAAYDFTAPVITAFTGGDVTPSISNGYVFSVPQAVTITNFDNPPSSGTKLIEVIASVDNINITHNVSQIKLQGGLSVKLNTDDSIVLRYDGTTWVERYRSFI